MRLVPLLLLTSAAWAHTAVTTKITYTKEIARLIEKRCLRCHAAGSDIPLAAYNDVRAWAVAIREQVQTRAMPRWDAVRGFGQFRDDESLTQPEIDLFVQWVEGGTPKGDDLHLPVSGREPAPPQPKFGGSLYLRWERRIRSPLVLAGIRPSEAAEGATFQVTAILADGRVEPLLWINNYRKRWNRTYVFREPVVLPAGSRLELNGPPGTLVSGWLAPEPRRAR